MTSSLAWCSLAPVRTHATGSRVRSDDIDSGQRAAERRATGWQVCGRGAIATRSRGARTQSQQCRRRWNNQPSQQMKQTNTTKNVRKRRTLAALNRVRSRNLIYPHVRRRRRRERAKPVHHTHTHMHSKHAQHTELENTCKCPAIKCEHEPECNLVESQQYNVGGIACMRLLLPARKEQRIRSHTHTHQLRAKTTHKRERIIASLVRVLVRFRAHTRNCVNVHIDINIVRIA